MRVWPILGVLAGCAGIAPGDYAVYQLAFGDIDYGADCYGGTVPDGVAEDDTTLRSAGVLVVYAGPDKAYFAEVGGGTAIPGTKSGGVFTFEGSDVDVTVQGDAEITETLDVSIEMSTSGRAVDGSIESRTATACTGSCDGFDDSSCTQTATFVGTQLRNVELPYESLEVQ